MNDLNTPTCTLHIAAVIKQQTESNSTNAD